jgi:hypothetical protein
MLGTGQPAHHGRGLEAYAPAQYLAYPNHRDRRRRRDEAPRQKRDETKREKRAAARARPSLGSRLFLFGVFASDVKDLR